jgi:hypothetical protein
VASATATVTSRIVTATATAEKLDYVQDIAPVTALDENDEQLLSQRAVTAVQAAIERLDREIQQADQQDRLREAKIKGFEGDACHACGNFTLVRNGTCLKCVSCGSTSGCS